MKPSSVPAALREMANKWEALGLSEETEINVYPRLSVHHVSTREDLAKLLTLVVKPRLNKAVPCIVSSGSSDFYEVTLYHEPGLLGGERREIYVDSQAGLNALLAELSPREALA